MGQEGSDGSYRRLMVTSFVLVGALTVAFLALAGRVREVNALVGLDRATQRVRRSGPVEALFADDGLLWLGSRLRPEQAVNLGGRTAVVLMACVLALVALAWRDRIGALVAIGGPALTGALTEYVIKPLVNVPSPVGARAFPSGHAGGVAAVALVAVILVYRRWRWLATLLVAPFGAFAVLLVGEALLRLQFHYPTDVIGGVLLAAVVVLGMTTCLMLYRGPGYRLLRRKERRSTDPSILDAEHPQTSGRVSARDGSESVGHGRWPRGQSNRAKPVPRSH